MDQPQQLQLQQLQQLHQLQQQQLQQHQQQHFIPIQAERAGGAMLRHAVNKLSTNNNANSANNVKANAVLGISIPAPVIRNSMISNKALMSAPAIATTPARETAESNLTTSDVTVAANPASADPASADPLIGMVQDVIFAMILNVPALRTKLQVILDNPSLISAEISKVYDELQNKLTVQELEQLNSYACQDSSRRTIVSVMKTAFANIMADGKIDMSDAPHFLTLIHDCITLFSDDAASSNSVALNGNTVITFLHFVLKCILILTLDDPEETAALVMLDGSFKLVKLTVMPLLISKKWCSCFS
uniref:Uncharacterized protein n=1 Tax=viral metagenome TaxID=1070528 RepID=A0A6C0I457_9ZZZZ